METRVRPNGGAFCGYSSGSSAFLRKRFTDCLLDSKKLGKRECVGLKEKACFDIELLAGAKYYLQYRAHLQNSYNIDSLTQLKDDWKAN